MEEFLDMMEKARALSAIMENFSAPKGELTPPVLEEYAKFAVNVKEASGEDWQRVVLQSIRPNMDDKKKCMIDILIKCMEIRQIMDKMNRLNEGGQ